MDAFWIIVPILFLGAIVGGSTGFGMYLVVGPSLWLLYTPTEAIAIGFAVGLASPMLLLSLWRWIDWQKVKILLIFALPGMCLGLMLYLFLPASLLYVLAGCTILVSVALRFNAGYLQTPTAGALAGALTTSVGFNGPPVSLAMHGEEERVQRSTIIFVLLIYSSVAFALFNLFGKESFLPAYGTGLLLLPVSLAGILLGNALAHRLGRRIEWIALAVSTLGAIFLLLRGIFS